MTKRNGEYIYGRRDEDSRWRRTGKVSNETLEIWRDTRNIFYKYNSVGFDKPLIEETQFSILKVLLTDGRTLVTTRDFFLANCFPHQENGWGEQLHLEISQFGLDNVKKWKKSQERNPFMKLVEEMQKQKRKKGNGTGMG